MSTRYTVTLLDSVTLTSYFSASKLLPLKSPIKFELCMTFILGLEASTVRDRRLDIVRLNVRQEATRVGYRLLATSVLD